MNFDKRTIFAVILIGLVLVFVQTEFYQDRFMPPPPELPEQSTPLAQESREQTGGIFEGLRTTESTLIQPAEPAEPAQEEEMGSFVSLVGDGNTIMIETPLYFATLSSKGATIHSWRLKAYDDPNDEPVQLVGQPAEGNLALLLPVDLDTIDTSPFVFSYDKSAIRVEGNEAQESITFTLNLGNDRIIRKTYTFYPDKYSVDLRVELLNFNGYLVGFSYYLTWRSGMPSTEPDLKTDMESAQGYVYQGDSETFNISDEPETELFDNTIDWVGIRTKYFATAVIPTSAKGQSVLFHGTPVDVGQKVPLRKYGFELKMPFDQKARRIDDFTVFLGPLDYEIVKSYNVDLEEMVDLGWSVFKPFGKFILWSFKLLHGVIPNYGFVIIVFSILIKLLLYPLTKKSYQSMKEMQALQPVIQELKEKYKDDSQKQQQETMKLYKEYGINPLGGCIPMVLQMPLLIALFQIFQSTIELRGASFIFWITDLSRPDTVATLPFTIPLYGDTVNILPLFMGVTMFIQQKISMKDPKQKALVYFMPIFFTLMFNSFPSGLNLYYSLFNLFSILQEKLVPHSTRTLDDLKKKSNGKPKQRRRVKHDYRGRKY